MKKRLQLVLLTQHGLCDQSEIASDGIVLENIRNSGSNINKQLEAIYTSTEDVYYVTFGAAKMDLEKFDNEYVSFKQDTTSNLFLVKSEDIDWTGIKNGTTLSAVTNIETKNGVATITNSNSTSTGNGQTQINIPQSVTQAGQTNTGSNTSTIGDGKTAITIGTSEISTTAAGENKYYFDIDDGTFALVLRDKDGNIIPDAEYKIFDMSGNEVIMQTVTGDNVKGLSVQNGRYYILLPNNADYSIDFEKINNNIMTTDPLDLVTVTNNYAYNNGLQTNDDDAELFEMVFSGFIILMGKILEKLIAIVAGQNLSIDALVFDQYPKTSLTLFTADNSYFTAGINPYIDGGAHDAINFVYSAFRKISLVIYVIMLVYMGIRILLVSTADKKAKFKEMIFDWIKGVAILFLFPYVIRYVILFNHQFVTFLHDNTGSIFEKNGSATIEAAEGTLANSDDINAEYSVTNYMTKMYDDATRTLKLSYSICWFVMLIQVVQFLIVYLKRLITVVFLVTISPLISISYAIDKIGDGKSQAFDHWCKEFILQVFIQSFHALNYVLVMGIVFSLTDDNWFLQIIGITYVAKGGDIIKGMFAQMGGGGTDGPMKVAGALIKTKVALGAVKGLKKTASRVIGSESLIGRGFGKIGDYRNKTLLAKEGMAKMRASKFLEDEQNAKKLDANTTMFNSDGTRRNLNMSDEDIKNSVNGMLKSGATDAEIKNNADQLAAAGVSEEQLDKALNDLGMTDRKGDVIDAVNNAAAISIISNNKKFDGFTVKQSIDVVLKGSKSGNSLIDKYNNAAGTPSDKVKERVRDVAAARSIFLDEDRRAERIQEERKTNVKSVYSMTGKERVAYSMNAIKDAGKGGHNLEELNEHYAYIRTIQASHDYELNKDIETLEKDMAFTLDDFGTNLAVQTINNADKFDKEDRQYYVDRAINNLNAIPDDRRNTAVLNELNADIDSLKLGEMPKLSAEKAEEVKRSKFVQELQSKIDDGTLQIGTSQEYRDVLQNSIDETLDEARKDLLAGVGMVAAGIPASRLKIGYGIATAGLAVGSQMQGKEEPISELATVVPEAFNLSEKVTHGVGQVASWPVKKVTSQYTDYDGVNLKTRQKAIDINDKYYANQSKKELERIEKKISATERERNNLMKKINEAANKTK